MSSQADLLAIVEQLAVSVAELEKWRNSFTTTTPYQQQPQTQHQLPHPTPQQHLPSSEQGPFAEAEKIMKAQRLEAEQALKASREELAAAEREYAALLNEQ